MLYEVQAVWVCKKLQGSTILIIIYTVCFPVNLVCILKLNEVGGILIGKHRTIYILLICEKKLKYIAIKVEREKIMMSVT